MGSLRCQSARAYTFIDRAITHYQELANSTAIRISKVSSGGNIVISWTNLGTMGPCAQAAFPSGGNPGNFIQINAQQTSFQANKSDWTPAIIHELGHTLGLGHTNEGGSIIPTTPSDERASIMRGGSCNEPALGFTNYDHKALIYLYPPAGTRPLLRWWFPSQSKHFFSVLTEGLNTDPQAPTSFAMYEGNAGLIYTGSASGRSPIYRFNNLANNDHFYTLTQSEGTALGYQYEFIAGYINNSQVTGTLPFYRFWNPTIQNHFMDVNPNPPSGYVSDGTVGFIVATPL